MNDRTAKRLLDALQACRQLVMLMNDVGREQFRSDAVLRLAANVFLRLSARRSMQPTGSIQIFFVLFQIPLTQSR